MNKVIIGSIVFFLFLAASAATLTQQAQAPVPVTTPVYDINGHRLNAHGVVGQVSIPAGAGIAVIPVTLAGEAAFTNANSYKCFSSQLTGVFGGTFNMADGSHLTIRAPRSDVVWQIDFFCIGS